MHKIRKQILTYINKYIWTREISVLYGVLLLVAEGFLIQGCNLNFISPPDNSQIPSTPPGHSRQAADPQLISLNQFVTQSRTMAKVIVKDGSPVFLGGSVPVAGDSPVSRAFNFINTYQIAYGQENPDLALNLRRIGGPDDQDVVLYQTYKDIPIYAVELVVSLDKDEVYAVSGKLLTDVNLNPEPLMDAFEAEDRARQHIVKPDSAVVGETSLIVFDHNIIDESFPSNPHLAWLVNLRSVDTWRLFVDAQNGEVLFANNLTAQSWNFQLRDANGNNGDLSCYDFTDGDVRIGDESGLFPAASSDSEAMLAWNFARDSYNFYWDNFRRDGWNNDGGRLSAYIHASSVGGASWLHGCNIVEFEDGFVAKDIMVHEVTHGVIASTSNLVRSNQPGALDEAFADIMGMLSDPGDWVYGDHTSGGLAPFRDLSSPPRFGQPDHFRDYRMISSDNGGVHTNSGIVNKTAYLLAEGGIHYGIPVRAIGRSKVAQLYYATMVSLPSSASFTITAEQMVARARRWAASRVNGFDSINACSVQNAWTSVGLYPSDIDCDGIPDSEDTDRDGDFVPDRRDNCPNIPNLRQIDTDRDERGDVCDEDLDNDTILNGPDNCPMHSNPGQDDVDEDGIGDVCDDSDGDGVLNFEDNCPNTPNSGQRNWDGDLLGDACDDDDDNDDIPDSEDLCNFHHSTNNFDSDGDGVGDPCDNCPVPNPYQRNSDDDEFGDVCDEDDDNDGLLDEDDNCPRHYNPDQIDFDNNQRGLACDSGDVILLDGIDLRGLIQLVPNLHIRFPLPTCLNDGCPGNFGSDGYEIFVLLSGLPQGADVFLSDGLGGVIARPSSYIGQRFLHFSPLGGYNYFLNIVFGAKYKGSMQPISLTVNAAAGPEDQISPSASDGAIIPVINSDSLCWKGPGSDWETVSSVLIETQVEILGIGALEGWLVIDNPRYPGVACWLQEDNLDIDPDLDLSNLRVFPVPPVVIVPTDTDTPPPPPPPPQTPPSAPANLSVTNHVCAYPTYSVTLGWFDQADNEQGYRVYRNNTLITTLGANANSYTDLPPGSGPYTYKVESFNGVGSANATTSDGGCIF